MITRSSRTVAGGVLALAIACAEPEEEEVLAPADLAEVCGEEAPAKLLSLESNELAPFVAPDAARPIAWVRTYEHDIGDGPVHASTFVSSRLVSFGPCGEDPRVVFDGDASPTTAVSPTTPRLAMTFPDQHMFWIDPTGRRSAQFVGHGSVVAEHESTLYLKVFSEDERSASLVRMVVDADAFTLETVLPDLSISGANADGVAPPGTALVVTLAEQLVEVDLETGAATPWVPGLVESFLRSADGRFVAYRAARDHASASLLQPWYVVDRETGASAELADADDILVGDAAVVTLWPETGSTHVVLLPGLQRHVLRGKWTIFMNTDDGRVVGTRIYVTDTQHERELWVWDDPQGEPRRLPFRGAVTDVHLDGDELLIAAENGDLLRMPLDGSHPRKVASDVRAPLWLGDTRFATLRHVDDFDVGELVVSGLGAAPTLVDADVFAGLRPVEAESPRSFYYNGRDGAHDGRGLYRVEIAP